MNIEKLIDELNALLDELADYEDNEDVEELNATLEDVLFMLSESDDEDDFEDELEDAVDELFDIANGYKEIADTAKYGDSIAAIANRIIMVMKNS
ncbi:MAG: hypothetical protein IJC56_05355 [Clostridia bacterium]|nr:hypothetical protein [Clostridia bacterium]